MINKTIIEYLHTEQDIKEFKEAIKVREESNSARLKYLIEACAEQGLTLEVITATDEDGEKRKVKIGYETVYTAIGGEFKEPTKRVELFSRIREAGYAGSEKIVFKPSFYVTESGNIAQTEDAGIPGNNWKKLIEGLPVDFRNKLIEDGLLGFYTYPVLKEV